MEPVSTQCEIEAADEGVKRASVESEIDSVVEGGEPVSPGMGRKKAPLEKAAAVIPQFETDSASSAATSI